MSKRCWILCGSMILAQGLLPGPSLSMAAENPESPGQPSRPLRIHIISGSAEYKSEHSLSAFAKHLESHYEVRATASWGQDKGDNLENLRDLEEAQLLIVFARRLNLPEAQMNQVRQHWERGKPVIGIRTASHAFQAEDNLVFDRQVLGGNYQGHYGDEPVRVTAVAGLETHPILRGVRELTSSKLYKEGELGPGTIVLQTGDNGLGQQPVTFIHTYRGGRTFYTSLGTPEDFAQESFQQMLVNAVFWTTGRSPVRKAKGS